MKDFNRLLDDKQTDPLEADLLRLARKEGPSAESRRRILAGLGAAAAVGTVSRPSAGAYKVAAPRATLKWTGAGIVAVGSGVAALLWLGSQQPAASRKLVKSTKILAPERAHPAALTSASNAADSQPAPLPGPPQMLDKAARSVAQPAPSLAEEVAAIRSAKRVLAAGDAAQALRELQAYQAHFPHGRLAQEAHVVRIEALLKLGNRAAANAAADRFLSAHPDSPYAARVHTLIGR